MFERKLHIRNLLVSHDKHPLSERNKLIDTVLQRIGAAIRDEGPALIRDGFLAGQISNAAWLLMAVAKVQKITLSEFDTDCITTTLALREQDIVECPEFDDQELDKVRLMMRSMLTFYLLSGQSCNPSQKFWEKITGYKKNLLSKGLWEMYMYLSALQYLFDPAHPPLSYQNWPDIMKHCPEPNHGGFGVWMFALRVLRPELLSQKERDIAEHASLLDSMQKFSALRSENAAFFLLAMHDIVLENDRIHISREKDSRNHAQEDSFPGLRHI
jgi:hypothetical protein